MTATMHGEDSAKKQRSNTEEFWLPVKFQQKSVSNSVEGGEVGMEVVTDSDNTLEHHLIHLMERYEKDLLRMCCVYLQDRTLAEDAVQETFLKAYQGLAAFRGDCVEKTWLMRIAMNTCKNMRRNAWFRFVEQRITPENLPQPAPYAEADSITLTQEVMHLPRKQQEVILLHYYQGLTGREIAQALGISDPAVSKRLKQARARLHIALEGGEENDE
jgi:RNA polymerase sigma-70 factor (ECF subfamily)